MSRRLISILILAFSLRFLFFLFNRNYTYTYHYEKEIPEEAEYFKKMIPPFDSQEFLALAKNLSEHHRFSWAQLPNTFRTPLYPIFISLFGRFAFHPIFAKLIKSTGEGEEARTPLFIFLQIILGTATVFFLFCLGKQLFGQRAGEISAFLLAIDIPNILFNNLIMSETLLLFFLVTGTFLLFRKQFFLSGIIFSLSALTKPIALYTFLPIFFFLLFSRTIKSAFSFLLAFSLLPTIWMIRNYRYYHTFAFTSIDGYNLLYHNLPALEMELMNLPFCDAKEAVWRKVKEEMKEDNPFLLSQKAFRYARKRIWENLPRYLLIHLKGMFLPLLGIKSDDLFLRLLRYQEKNGKIRQSLFDTTLPPFFRGLIIIASGWEIVTVLLSLLLFILSLRFASNRWALSLLFLLMFYFLFLSSPLPDGRFRLPSLPFLYLGGSSFFRLRRE